MKKSFGYLLIVVLLLSFGWTKAKKIECDGERALQYFLREFDENNG